MCKVSPVNQREKNNKIKSKIQLKKKYWTRELNDVVWANFRPMKH